MRRRGPFDLISGTALGMVADWLYSHIGRWMPNWALRVIAGFWDAVDILTRVLLWPFFLLVPGLSHVVRGVLDLVLVFVGAALCGTTGLLQMVEIVFEIIPGFGWFFDLMPMLSIGVHVFIKRGREGAEVHLKPAAADSLPVAHERSTPMEIIGGLIGAVVGLVLWLVGAIGFKWFILIALVGVAAGFLVRILQWVEVPSSLFRFGMIIAGALLVIDLAILGGLALFTSEEGYRAEAWQELVDKGDVRVKLAGAADKAGSLVSAPGVAAAAGEAAHTLREKAATALEGAKPDVPAVQDLMKWFAKATKPAPPQQAPPSKETARSKQEAAELNLGPASSALYRSDYVLERAKKIRSSWLWFVGKFAIAFATAFAFLAFAGLVQQTPGGPAPRRIDPTFDIHDRGI